MSLNDRKEIYDDIVFDYAAVKTNVFKSKYEESSFWKALGNIEGISVLDLACGSGYYTRQFKEKHAMQTNSLQGTTKQSNAIMQCRAIS